MSRVEEKSYPIDISMDESYSLQLIDIPKKQWDEFNKELKRSQKKLSVEAIHETRIKIRRLRAMMAVLANLLPSLKFNKSRRELKELLETLAPLRDLQVQIQYLQEFLPSHPESEQYIQKLRRKQRRLKSQVAEKVSVFQSRHIKTTIYKAVHDLETSIENTARRETVAAKLQDTLRQAYNEVINQGKQVQLTDVSTIHTMRIALKKFRYMAEVLRPFIDWDERQYQYMRDLQGLLGGIQDLQVMINSLNSYTAKETAFPLLPLIQELSQRQSDLIDKLSEYRDSQGEWRFLVEQDTLPSSPEM